MSKTIQIKLKKSDKMIADGHGNVNATITDWMLSDCSVNDHEWSLVYRWGTPKPGRKVKFAAQAKIDGKVTQLHRFVMRHHQKTQALKKAGVEYVVLPIDGNALNCEFENLEDIISKEEWEKRTCRDKSDQFKTTDEENRFVDAHSIALGYPRQKFWTEAIRMKIASMGGLPPAPEPDEFA
jgi:hypothetical protein